MAKTEVQTERQNVKERLFKWLWTGMVVGARWAALSFSETADPLGFSHTTISIEFTQSGPKTRKYLRKLIYQPPKKKEWKKVKSELFRMSPYRLHLFGDGSYLLAFGPQVISLFIHHLLQL